MRLSQGCTALMGLMECRWWGLMLKCFALGLWQFPWGLFGLLSLIDFFMPWMLKAVAALNFGACLWRLLWLCLLCFGWVGLCLGALALALPALPWVGFALPWVGFALALRALLWLGWALPWVGFALPWVGLCFALGGVLGAWGVWCWVLGVLGVWGVGCLGWCRVSLLVSALAGLVSARSGFGRSPLGCSGFARLRLSGHCLRSVGLRSGARRVFGLRSASGVRASPPFLRPSGFSVLGAWAAFGFFGRPAWLSLLWLACVTLRQAKASRAKQTSLQSQKQLQAPNTPNPSSAKTPVMPSPPLASARPLPSAPPPLPALRSAMP